MISFDSLRMIQQRQSWGLGGVIQFQSDLSMPIILEKEAHSELPIQDQTLDRGDSCQQRCEEQVLLSLISVKSLSTGQTFGTSEIESQNTEIKQSFDQGSSDSSVSQFDKKRVLLSQKRKNAKKQVTKKISKKQPYPTKNFLQSFRSSFVNYLGRYFSADYFEKIPIISRIRGKKSINLKDYEQIFNYAEFKPLLEAYFSEKVILRDLSLSRIEKKTKEYYLGKIYVFEQAFRKGVFKKINY